MVELVSLCGYYTLVSFLLNAFDVPLLPDANGRCGNRDCRLLKPPGFRARTAD